MTLNKFSLSLMIEVVNYMLIFIALCVSILISSFLSHLIFYLKNPCVLLRVKQQRDANNTIGRCTSQKALSWLSRTFLSSLSLFLSTLLCASACIKINSHFRENIFCNLARFSASQSANSSRVLFCIVLLHKQTAVTFKVTRTSGCIKVQLAK